ncbi:uncharacterized mitochondrial protein AtMg00810-like [Cornus florida]|uniref:uncharacterized mitochondrial protein AtMg00810-like n=1 Tax=Cornus florida TaxID=4283 RepID=UPI00289A59E5|nr:uncharacterized mitochondrial protein AtMg00810-like [Cornus florida]
MKKYGFKQALVDHTLFYKRNGDDITLLIVYMDDMIVIGSNTNEIEKLRSYLAKEFEMKDLGVLKYFLGIEVSRFKQELFISQQKYTLDLLAETGNSACVPIDTPIENPNDRHMNAVNHILAYLKSSLGKGIIFSRHRHLDIIGYTDFDFAGAKLDRKTTSGYVSFVGGNLVTWRSKKQNVVSLSSAEAEYRALHHAITELTWLKILLSELGYGLRNLD